MAAGKSIGIIVYSGTGNTLSVAEQLREKLAGSGREVKLERLAVCGGYNPQRSVGPIRFETLPDLTVFDAIVFAGPVQAFSLSVPMTAYLSQVAGIKGKRTALLVTEAFPFAWMGGNQAIAKMKRICAQKGAAVSETGIVNWWRKHRAQRIAGVIDRLAAWIG